MFHTDFEQVNTDGVVLFSITSRIDQQLLLQVPFIEKKIYSKVDLGPYQIAMIDLFNGWKLLPIFGKRSFSDVQWRPEYASETFCTYARSLQLY